MPVWTWSRITNFFSMKDMQSSPSLANPAKIALPKFSKLQILVHIGALIPLMLLVVDWFNNNLTVNPIQALQLRTGKYALVLLILSLSCTPLNTVFGFRQALKVRRPLGLYAFFYASLHFLIFIGLDYQFDLNLILEATFEKRYALVGFVAGVILLALAVTSTKGWKKRLGRTWTRLHKFVYLAGLLVIIHYILLVKSDIRIPLLYGAVVMILLILRIPVIRRPVSQLKQHHRFVALKNFLSSAETKIP